MTELDYSVVFERLPILLEGCFMTLQVATASLFFGMILGVAGALCRLSGNGFLRRLVLLYVWVIRGTPFLVQLFILYFGLPQLGLRLDSMTAGIMGLSLNTGAYITEIIRSGIQAVDRGQSEAAVSLGMNYALTMRRIVGPQAAKICIPPLVNQFIMTLKNSSITSLVTITELVRSGEQIISTTFRSFETYTVVALFYLALNSVFMVIAGHLERKAVRQ
jgi:polar amino acid transport system permease protein